MDDSYEVGFCGQYAIYTNYGEDNGPTYIYAYDLNNNKSYNLMDLTSVLGNGNMDVYTGTNDIY